MVSHNNTLGVVSGLLLVALMVAMIGSFGRVSAIVHGAVSTQGFELAGSSRPAP